MQSCSSKLKVSFLLFGILILSGFVRNFDLRKQAKENRAQEQKSISSMQGTVDTKENIQNEEPVHPIRNEPADYSASNGVKILFIGDMMFDRHIREAVEKYGSGDYNYIFKPMKDKLSEYDLVVGNLEGPITDNKSVSTNTKMDERANLVFTFDSKVAEVLAENNIKLVNLGNNHILNQGAKGVEETKKYLVEAGVEYFNEDNFLAREVEGIRLGIVGYNYSVADSEQLAIENIQKAREQSDIVVVCSHWGAEYKTGEPGNSVRTLAYRFVDAGADLVIGTHPHVIQNSEEYNGKKIYYSLGNFVFDQYFSRETMEGLGAEMTIKTDLSMEYNELKFEMTKRGQTKLKFPIPNF